MFTSVRQEINFLQAKLGMVLAHKIWDLKRRTENRSFFGRLFSQLFHINQRPFDAHRQRIFQPEKKMKTILLSILIVIGLICAPLASGSSPEKALSSTESYQLPDLRVEGGRDLPVPMRMDAPKLGKDKIGQKIDIRFMVNEKGQTINIRPRLAFYETADLAAAMTNAMTSWKFRPALDKSGNPKKTKLLMPVKVIEIREETALVAKILIDE